MPTISVVTPSLNQGLYIERTVRSVLEQSCPDIDYVVCDGGSTDNTLRILSEYAGRLRLISEPDGGQADAVNKGLQLTAGEIIGWLNSDDVYCPEAFPKLLSFLAANADIDVVYGDARLIDAADDDLGPYYTEPWNPERLQERCFLCQPAVFFRRRVVDRFGLLDKRLHYCMDYEYWLRLAAGGARFAYLPVDLARSRLYPETKTLGSRLAVHSELNAMLRRRLGRVPENWLLNHAHTLTELRHADRTARGFGKPLTYSLEVLSLAIALSLRWNGSVSRTLFARWVHPVSIGAKRRVGEVASRVRAQRTT